MRLIATEFILASLFSSYALAGTMGDKELGHTWRLVGQLSAGSAWASSGNTQTFYLTPEIEKSYIAQKESNALAIGELFAGIQRELSSSISGQIGLEFAITGNAKMQGVIWDDADPEFNNHRYQYNVKHNHVAIKGKLIKDCGYSLMPWASASLGVGFNQSYGFNNTPLIFEALPNANYTNHTQTAFSYTLGVGLLKEINEHWQAGIGYELSDWGKSMLGRAPGQTLGQGLQLSHLYTNGLTLNITYLS